MWYNEEYNTRGFEVIFPDELKITKNDSDNSPIRGWSWHDDTPQQYLDWLESLETEEP